MMGGIDPMSLIPETEIGKVLWEHERKLSEHDKLISGVVQKMDGVERGVEELKTIVINGNKESMELFRSVINHEQNMDKVKHDFKTKMQEMDLSMKQKQLEIQEKQQEIVESHKAEKEKWEREQKAESRKLIRDTVGKMVVWGGPIVIAVVTGITQFIETFFK